MSAGRVSRENNGNEEGYGNTGGEKRTAAAQASDSTGFDGSDSHSYQEPAKFTAFG